MSRQLSTGGRALGSVASGHATNHITFTCCMSVSSIIRWFFNRTAFCVNLPTDQNKQEPICEEHISPHLLCEHGKERPRAQGPSSSAKSRSCLRIRGCAGIQRTCQCLLRHIPRIQKARQKRKTICRQYCQHLQKVTAGRVINRDGCVESNPVSVETEFRSNMAQQVFTPNPSPQWSSLSATGWRSRGGAKSATPRAILAILPTQQRRRKPREENLVDNATKHIGGHAPP